jgi:hypothetical protein
MEYCTSTSIENAIYGKIVLDWLINWLIQFRNIYLHLTLAKTN